MKPSKYSTIMPQVAIESLKLINSDFMVRLIGQSLEGIFSFLASSTYRDEIVSTCGDRVEPGLLEEALYQNYAKTFNKLLKNSSSYIKSLLKSVLYKFDALNLKTMLRMQKAGINTEEILQHIIPLGTFDKKKSQEILSEANSINDIIDSLQDQDFGSILNEAFKTRKGRKDLSYLEAALDKEVYKRILRAIKKLDRQDKKIATNILGIEIDTLNVQIILKYKTLMIDHEKIRKVLMPTVSINEKILESAIDEPDLKSMFQYLSSSMETKHEVYQNTFTKLVKESDSPISRLEFILEKVSLEMSFFELNKNMRYYNIGFILAFLNMKWMEIRNLRCIINAMARNVDVDQVRDLLILPEDYKI